MGEEQPGGSFLPFVTTVTTDIYERIEKVSNSLQEAQTSLRELLDNVNSNLEKVSKNVEELIEQGVMNKTMILEAFVNSMNTLANEIRNIRNENIEVVKSPETQKLISTLGQTAKILEARMNDIQIGFFISGIHSLINGIKAGRVVGLPVAVRGGVAPAIIPEKGGKPELAAPVPTLTASETTEKGKAFFGKGVRKKTHDEIMEEKRRKDKLFGAYLK